MLKMKTYPYILSIPVTMKLLHPSSYVAAMEKVQEWNQDILSTNTSPEPVSQLALS